MSRAAEYLLGGLSRFAGDRDRVLCWSLQAFVSASLLAAPTGWLGSVLIAPIGLANGARAAVSVGNVSVRKRTAWLAPPRLGWRRRRVRSL